uniref:DUF3955 domain-containing protein n=1 Tax=uncultured Lactobacillus sp. TaxID=153152 RepID=UPI002620FE52
TSTSITDLFSRIDAISKIISTDKKILADINEKKDSLNKDMETLNTKNNELKIRYEFNITLQSSIISLSLKRNGKMMRKYLNKKALISGVSLMVLGIVCILISALVVNIGPNGMLREFFFLIPLGWILILIGSGVLIVAAFLALRKEDKAVNAAIRLREEKEKSKSKSEK